MEGIRDIPKNFKEGLESLKTTFTQSIDNLKSTFSQGLEDLKNGMKNILMEIFVPSEDYLTEKVNHIKEKFAFASSILDTADAFKDMFSVEADEPPTLVINLGNAESKYNYGDTAFALDMSWYARYKPSVDAILSSIMWVIFAWRLFVSVPNIVSGVGGSFEMAQDLRNGNSYMGVDRDGNKVFLSRKGMRKR